VGNEIKSYQICFKRVGQKILHFTYLGKIDLQNQLIDLQSTMENEEVTRQELMDERDMCVARFRE
jgi:hypothetical protein